MSNNPMKKRGKPCKHISQLDPTQKAKADQFFHYALLAIVQQQGKTVNIPADHAEMIYDTHRLKLTVEGGNIVLEAEAMESQIIVPDGKLIQ